MTQHGEQVERVALKWLPIKTAPKDGTWIIVQAGDGHPSTARWNVNSGKWENAANMLDYDDYYSWPVDKWMPLLDTAAAVEAEREACAKIVAWACLGTDSPNVQYELSQACQLIRARGGKGGSDAS